MRVIGSILPKPLYTLTDNLNITEHGFRLPTIKIFKLKNFL